MVSVTEPEQVGKLTRPLVTETATVNGCVGPMLVADGITFTVGVIFKTETTIGELDAWL